jgi:rare lipoprotein A (peptidoglycan hydrolase)
MKKPYVQFLVFLLSFTCGNTYSQSRGSKFSHLEQNVLNVGSRRKIIPPTQMVQKNWSSGIVYSNQPDFDNENQEIANSFIDDDGSYIGKYKVGNQYEVGGIEYQPQQYGDFEEVGIASWYGDDFHGKKTANGETYHKGDMTAAHPTLPLPSIARITNLDNGKLVKVRINDRGPFSKKRIVDVSEKAAKELGFRDKGTANVKLEFLKEDTDRLLRELKIEKEKN